MEPSRKVLEESNELCDNIVIPDSALLQKFILDSGTLTTDK